jgi:hypothetical protein
MIFRFSRAHTLTARICPHTLRARISAGGRSKNCRSNIIEEGQNPIFLIPGTKEFRKRPNTPLQ